MATAGTIAVNIIAYTGRFIGPLGKARAALFQFNTAIATVGATALGAMVSNVERLNRAMERSTSIALGMTEKLKADMREVAIDLVSETHFGATELASTFGPLISSGMEAKEAIKALPIVANFAQAANADLADSTRNLTKAYHSMRLETGDVEKDMKSLQRVADAATAGNILTTAEVSQMGLALARAGGSMRRYGIEVEEGAAILAMFISGGLEAEESATALDLVMRDLTRANRENAAIWEENGLATADAAGEFYKLHEILGLIEAKIGSMAPAAVPGFLKELGLPSKSVRYVNALLGFSGALEEVERKTMSLGGITNHVAKEALTPFQRAWQDLREEFTRFEDTHLVGMVDRLTHLMSVVSEGITTVNSLTKSWNINLTSLLRWGAAILIGVKTFQFMMMVIPKIINIFGILTKAYKTLSIMQLIQQAASGPKGWGTLAVSIATAAAAVGGFLALTSKFDDDLKSISKDTAKFSEEAMKLDKALDTDALSEKLATEGSWNDVLMEAEAAEESAKSAEKLRKEAAKEALRDAEELKRRAESITDALRTPWEEFRDTMSELVTLLHTFDESGASLIDPETYRRGVAKAVKDLAEARKALDGSSDVDVKVKGTAEEYSARSAYMSHAEKMIAYTKEMARELPRITAELKAIHATTLGKTEPTPATIAP